MRARLRVKLWPISSSSRSMLRRPSPILIRQNGMRIAVSTKITPKSPGGNQIAARIAQPMEGNEFSTGLMRSFTTASRTGTRSAMKASTPPMSSAAATETSTRHVEASVCSRNSGVTKRSTSRRATETGAGRMNSGNRRASSHQPTRPSTTRLSPIRRCDSGMRAGLGGIVAGEGVLQRCEDEPVHSVHEGDDDDDGGDDGRGVEFLPRQVDQVTEAAAAAEQLGGQGHLPGDAEHDA